MTPAQSAAAYPVHLESPEAARTAGLRYVSDDRPGIRRIRVGKSFRYQSADGATIRDPAQLSRIKSLAIPPAWTDVWICPSPDGHLQATGRDNRRRKQYRYHPRWREVRDETKYDRLVLFGRLLPKIRRQTSRDLARPGLPREKILAAVVRLLETTLIRIGNEEYARQNESFGLTTMRDRHVKVTGSILQFKFIGKSGIDHTISLQDSRLARVVKRSRDLPGYELFQYLDADGQRRSIESSDVNDYLRSIAGDEFTAKDFRTWAGTVLAATALQELQVFSSQSQAKRNVTSAMEAVAKKLGNTKTICRKCYVHPAIVNAYLDGSLRHVMEDRAGRMLSTSIRRLSAEETAVLALLQRRLQRGHSKKAETAGTRVKARHKA
jgi:DNA topoisomerase-1